MRVTLVIVFQQIHNSFSQASVFIINTNQPCRKSYGTTVTPNPWRITLFRIILLGRRDYFATFTKLLIASFP